MDRDLSVKVKQDRDLSNMEKKTDIAWTELDQTENSWSGCLSDRY